MVKTFPRRSSGPAPRRRPEASSFSVTTLTRPRAPGIIGRPMTSRASTSGLRKAPAGHADKEGFKQAINDFHRSGYGGPCPPRGHGPHHYHFRLLALSIDHLPLRKDPSCRDVEREACKHLIAEATLTGLYER
jgi:phosphatidylethanolamine-binding protein (PEBP) family uncharacterized protein